ncbi:hypothetical protein HY634_04100, partial [Candidatus Uhrbacteria bacterium]|nr:hypothetical protein [Candidatus Uhrbacteria bacterium]
MDARKVLEAYGLNGDEVALYLAALALGESPISVIAERAGVNRSTAYTIAKSLEARGLMGSYRMRGGLRFVAADPKTLLAQSRKRAEDIATIVPELEALAMAALHKPKVTSYEGKEGYFTVAEDALGVPNTTLLHIGSLTDIWGVIGKEYDLTHFVPRRLQQHIRIRCLYFPSGVKEQVGAMDHAKELREVRYLPEAHAYSNSMLVYRNKVAIFTSRKEFITVLIESEEIAEAERQKF